MSSCSGTKLDKPYAEAKDSRHFLFSSKGSSGTAPLVSTKSGSRTSSSRWWCSPSRWWPDHVRLLRPVLSDPEVIDEELWSVYYVPSLHLWNNVSQKIVYVRKQKAMNKIHVVVSHDNGQTQVGKG